MWGRRPARIHDIMCTILTCDWLVLIVALRFFQIDYADLSHPFHCFIVTYILSWTLITSFRVSTLVLFSLLQFFPLFFFLLSFSQWHLSSRLPLHIALHYRGVHCGHQCPCLHYLHLSFFLPSCDRRPLFFANILSASIIFCASFHSFVLFAKKVGVIWVELTFSVMLCSFPVFCHFMLVTDFSEGPIRYCTLSFYGYKVFWTHAFFVNRHIFSSTTRMNYVFEQSNHHYVFDPPWRWIVVFGWSTHRIWCFHERLKQPWFDAHPM